MKSRATLANSSPLDHIPSQVSADVILQYEIAETEHFLTQGSYNASKAAVHAYSNTLRVELSPFSVSVIVVMTGRVQSRLSRNKRTLRPDSLYQPISDEYARRVEHSQGDAMPAVDFAKSVVPQLLRPNPKMWIWEGKQSWSVWFMDRFVPRPRVHTVFQDMFDFKRISKMTEGK